MQVTLFVPYSNGDCVEGFKYDKPIDRNTYAKIMVNSYKKYRDGVDTMMSNDMLGQNIARNYFTKERAKYKQQTFYYQPVECKVFDMDNRPENIDNLLSYYNSGEQFIVIMALLNLSSADPSGELESDVKSWVKESLKINKTNKMTEEEKIASLTKKSLKIRFKDSKSSAILRDCKMIEVYSRNKFALLVEKIELVKE